MKVVNMGNIADAFRFDNLPATGIVIEATPEELKLLPNLAHKDVTISEHVANAAKMREALSGLLEIVCIDCKSPYEIDGKCVKCPRVVAAEAALSAPPRNCDVGTVAEQNERFDKYCYDHRSHEICCGKCPIFGEPCCELAWSQMLYEGADAK